MNSQSLQLSVEHAHVKIRPEVLYKQAKPDLNSLKLSGVLGKQPINVLSSPLGVKMLILDVVLTQSGGLNQ